MRRALTVLAMAMVPWAAAFAANPPLQEMQSPPLLPRTQQPPGYAPQPSYAPQQSYTPPQSYAQPPTYAQPPAYATPQSYTPQQTYTPPPAYTPSSTDTPPDDAAPAEAPPSQTQTDTAPDTGPDQSTAPSPPLDMTPQVQWPDKWVAAAAVRLKALDKIDAQATSLTIRVGQPVTFGSLTITVKACMVRPPDQPADAAAYLAVTDSHPDSPGFDGWMLANEPSVSMMQNPVYDIRITGCT